MEQKYELKGHSYQIADTGDYDGYFEITNGKVSILTKDTDDEGLQELVDKMNTGGWEFYLDDSAEFELHLLRQEVEQLRKQLNPSPAAEQPQDAVSDDAHEKEVIMQAFDKVRQLFEGRAWIMDGRGSYPYNDDRYKEEVRYLYDEFDAIQKDTWKNIKSKSFEYRQKIIAEYLKATPSGITWVNLAVKPPCVIEDWEDWHGYHMRYASDKVKLDLHLFEVRDGALCKIGGTGRLEFSEVEWMDESSTAPSQGREVEFAEWLQANRWFSYENGYWYYTFQHGTIMSDKEYNKKYRKTSAELYTLFITQTKQ